MTVLAEESAAALAGRMDILRFATAGSVDDGKSTLIGRLLYDTKTIFIDQLAAVEAASAARGDEYTNLALLTDGLRAEREHLRKTCIPPLKASPESFSRIFGEKTSANS